MEWRGVSEGWRWCEGCPSARGGLGQGVDGGEDADGGPEAQGPGDGHGGRGLLVRGAPPLGKVDSRLLCRRLIVAVEVVGDDVVEAGFPANSTEELGGGEGGGGGGEEEKVQGGPHGGGQLTRGDGGLRWSPSSGLTPMHRCC